MTPVQQKSAKRTTAALDVRPAPRRKRRPESFADWMARVDAEVDQAARAIAKKPPTFACLHPAQRRIVQMLIEHLRSLPALQSGESALMKKEYGTINIVLTALYVHKYPAWKCRLHSGHRFVDDLPDGECAVFQKMIRNCAGRAPAELASCDDNDD